MRRLGPGGAARAGRPPRPRGTWVAIAVVVLALSLAGPLGSALTPAAEAALASMHVVTAAILVPLMLGSMARR